MQRTDTRGKPLNDMKEVVLVGNSTSRHLLVFAVSAPAISLSLDGEIGANGSAITGTVVRLQGSIVLDDVVDTQISVLGVWSRLLDSANIQLNTSSTQSNNRTHTTTLTFDPLTMASTYQFTVQVFPLNPTYIEESSIIITNYSLTLQPYPLLKIEKVVISGECMINETATLRGSVNLLPNTATNHIITYTWIGPNGSPIRESSRDLTVREGTLAVRNAPGNFNLTVCLAFPGTDVVDHCTETVQFYVSTDGKHINKLLSVVPHLHKNTWHPPHVHTCSCTQCVSESA
jgi:hypothetical protein